MKIDLFLIPQSEVSSAIDDAALAANAAESGNLSQLESAFTALRKRSTPDSSPQLSEEEWRGVTAAFGDTVTHGELDFVLYGDSLDRWIAAARGIGALSLADWLTAVKEARGAVLQIPEEVTNGRF